jgi:hypothetical protein
MSDSAVALKSQIVQRKIRLLYNEQTGSVMTLYANVSVPMTTRCDVSTYYVRNYSELNCWGLEHQDCP